MNRKFLVTVKNMNTFFTGRAIDAAEPVAVYGYTFRAKSTNSKTDNVKFEHERENIAQITAINNEKSSQWTSMSLQTTQLTPKCLHHNCY